MFSLFFFHHRRSVIKHCCFIFEKGEELCSPSLSFLNFLFGLHYHVLATKGGSSLSS